MRHSLSLVCLLSLFAAVSPSVEAGSREFIALAEKQQQIVFSEIGFAVGPLAIDGDKIYFSKRVFNSAKCAGRDLYVGTFGKTNESIRLVSEIACVITLNKSAEKGVAVRHWKDEQIAVTLVDGDSQTIWKSPLQNDRKFYSDYRLKLFDTGGDFIDGPEIFSVPLNVNGWILSFTQGAGASRLVATAFRLSNKEVRTAFVPASTIIAHAQAVTTSDGARLYLPFEKHLLELPLGDSAKQASTIGSDREPNGSPFGTVAASQWSPRSIAFAKADVEPEGLWILDESRTSDLAPSVVWFYDAQAETVTGVPGLGTSSVSAIHPLTNGILLGTEAGSIEWYRARLAKEVVAAAVKPADCHFGYATVETAAGTQWQFFHKTATSAAALLQTVPLFPTDWACRGDELVILSKHFQVRWSSGETQFALNEGEPGKSLGTNVPSLLTWASEKPGRRIPFQDQDAFATTNTRPTLLVFSGSTLRKARVALAGTDFTAVLPHPKHKDKVQIKVKGATPDDVVPYRLQMKWNGDELQGEAL